MLGDLVHAAAGTVLYSVVALVVGAERSPVRSYAQTSADGADGEEITRPWSRASS